MARRAIHLLATTALTTSLLVATASPGLAIDLGTDFAGDYTVVDLGTPDGVPSSFGGLVLKRGDRDTLLLGGDANTGSGAIYEVPLARNASGFITGFAGPGVKVADAPDIDGGLAYEPGSGVLFFTGYSSNTIGQFKLGSTAPDKTTDVSGNGVGSSVGALTFAPSFSPDPGALKVISYSTGGFYDVPFSPDGSGTFTLGAATLRTTIDVGPEGISYVPGGSPGFPSPSLLISEYDENRVRAYEIDGDGTPDPSSARIFLDDLVGAEGAYLDSVTGEFLFSTFGGDDRVVVVRGFATAPEPADLSVTKSADVTGSTVGDLVRWTVEINNTGAGAAEDVVLTDELPDQVTFSDADAGCSHANDTVTCTVGDLAPGASAERRIVTTAVQAGTATNTASVTSDSPEASPGDNTDTAQVTLTSPPDPAERVAGIDRIETAIRASETTFEDGEAGAVLLARADTFPDALAGSPLAVVLNAPMLLTETGALLDVTADEMRRVLPPGGTVHLLGGPMALSEEVEQAVEALGFATTRHAGDDRYETAVAIAGVIPDPSFAILATGLNFPDALAAGTATAALGGAIVLTADEQVPSSTRAWIDANDGLPLYAAGGPSARAVPSATALAGDDRFETAVLIAEEFFPDPTAVGIATGANFADALSGASHLGRRRAPVVLALPDELPDVAREYLASRPRLARAFIFGGPAALSQRVEDQVVAALAGD